MRDNLEDISEIYVDSYKKLSIEDKKRELLDRVMTLSESYREACNTTFGVNKKFINENFDNIDINNEDELFNALFSYVIELDGQVGVFVENTIK